jgi:hypothetical protein
MANIPTPVIHGDYVYSAASMSGGGAVKLSVSNGDVTATPLYFSRKLPSAIGGTVVVGDVLYGTTAQALECVELASGKVKWSERGIGAGSIVYADHRLYLHGENGQIALIDASPDGYTEQGRFTPPNEPTHGTARAWAYPAIANGRLYIREASTIWCFDIKSDEAKRK